MERIGVLLEDRDRKQTDSRWKAAREEREKPPATISYTRIRRKSTEREVGGAEKERARD